jgi:hypothetical protein
MEVVRAHQTPSLNDGVYRNRGGGRRRELLKPVGQQSRPVPLSDADDTQGPARGVGIALGFGPSATAGI